MFANTSEKQMHRVRWAIALAWLLLIASLFYDPISPWLTDSNRWGLLQIHSDSCVMVQGECLEKTPYALGAPIFWGVIIPSSIAILLIFGHELWRRICPLSFFSQIPRALGRQRQQRRSDPKTGKVRYELAKVPKQSWLARYHLYLQFGLLYLGLCSRILFINANRIALGIFLILTILSAILVGYLYGGKSWCQYFCPMAPVQSIYAEPRGLLNSTAHENDRQTITQSMCRTVTPDGKEQSACVACQSPCIDIDAERAYWNSITASEQQKLYYGYVGLVIGYFVYYYLYAGNWNYYFSGAWVHQNNQLATLLSPGFYLFGRAIAIPKLLAVPLTLGAFTIGGYWLGQKLEKYYKTYLRRRQQFLSQEQVRHRMFTLCTFVVFNFFFIFGGRPFLLLLPVPIQYLYTVSIAIVSTLWLARTWERSSNRYSHESLAHRLRKQLSNLKLDVSHFLEGRSLDDLSAEEIYVLAKILPDFTKEKRLHAYKQVLRESIEQGYVNVGSLEVLQHLRRELTISDDEHHKILGELGIENPDLLDPRKQRSPEDWLRLESYREILETTLNLWQRRPARGLGADLLDVVGGRRSLDSIEDLSLDDPPEHKEALQALKREYAITPEEEEQILKSLDN
ncbi:4Fe-4S binding protein [Trichocoleus sp. DQ-U1]|uniref:4Fe-4S binding protein n=1 Tax=Trichocoleus sp. DQ-U1 TaxID=2933926 RepID=UPI0032985782